MNAFGGPPPFNSLKRRSQEKWPPHDCLWPTTLFFKSVHTIKMRMLEKIRQKRIGQIWCKKIFVLTPENFLISHMSLIFLILYQTFGQWYLILPSKKFHEDMCTSMRARGVNVRACEKNVCAFKINLCACVCAHIFVVVHCYLMSLGIKFLKDPTISCGDIPCFLTLYNLENEKKRILHSKS